MTPLDVLDEVPTEVRRDRFGRPYILPPGGTKPVPYTRVTTFIRCLSDETTLTKWKLRSVLSGVLTDPTLLDEAASAADKSELDTIADRAIDASKANDKRDKGTHLHTLSEYVDRGLHLPPETSEQDRADMVAYYEATKPLAVQHIETLTVNDDLKVAGTPDRIVSYQGRNYIGDLKSGSLDWSGLEFAMQMSIYSRSEFYDHAKQERSPLPDVDQERAIIFHLPPESRECRLYWLDLVAGWDAVQVARQVRAKRNVKNVLTPFGVAS